MRNSRLRGYDVTVATQEKDLDMWSRPLWWAVLDMTHWQGPAPRRVLWPLWPALPGHWAGRKRAAERWRNRIALKQSNGLGLPPRCSKLGLRFWNFWVRKDISKYNYTKSRNYWKICHFPSVSTIIIFAGQFCHITIFSFVKEQPKKVFNFIF